jgi:hypothetical protein
LTGQEMAFSLKIPLIAAARVLFIGEFSIAESFAIAFAGINLYSFFFGFSLPEKSAPNPANKGLSPLFDIRSESGTIVRTPGQTSAFTAGRL